LEYNVINRARKNLALNVEELENFEKAVGKNVVFIFSCKNFKFCNYEISVEEFSDILSLIDNIS
jgi:hypothetical protein